MDTLISWKFLDEPAYKWFIFLGLLIVSLAAWKLVLNKVT